MMFKCEHHDVRTTLTLEPDVANRLRSEVRRTGKSFKDVVNECLRVALTQRRSTPVAKPPFRIRPRDLGALRPGLNLDNIGALLEAAEGPLHK